jgi:hypothetical protein
MEGVSGTVAVGVGLTAYVTEAVSKVFFVSSSA